MHLAVQGGGAWVKGEDEAEDEDDIGLSLGV